MKRPALFFLVLGLLGVPLAAQHHVYVADLNETSVLLAWGTTTGTKEQNTIGERAVFLGPAEVRLNGRVLTPTGQMNWVEISGLQPDTAYDYQVFVNGGEIGRGVVRTYPREPTRLTFFVIGDFGTGKEQQYRLARKMWEEFERREKSQSPVRFVLTTGDNIYGSGDEDVDWERKFFRPYQELIARIPFLPSPGNHDGNETEKIADLPVYLDNFFLERRRPTGRYYSFRFGQLAEFFSLDTTRNSLTDTLSPMLAAEGPQFDWLKGSLPASTAIWKIPYFHHPPYTAGPLHRDFGWSDRRYQHVLPLFEKAGVKVAFGGHEHNLQVSDAPATGGILFIVSGAGGQLRDRDISREMDEYAIQLWAPQRHFLLVDIEGHEMRITPIGFVEIKPADKNGKEAALPIRVTVPPSQK